MPHRNLRIVVTSTSKFIHYFCEQHCSPCFKHHLTKVIRAEYLKCTIYISDAKIKHKAHNLVPAPGIELAHPWVLSIEPVAKDPVVLTQIGQQANKVIDIKLSICIHVKGICLTCPHEATHQSCAGSLVNLMRDQANARLLRCDSGNDRSCSILAAIIDHQYLKIRNHTRKSQEDSPHRCCNHSLFVIGWQYYGNADREVRGRRL